MYFEERMISLACIRKNAVVNIYTVV